MPRRLSTFSSISSGGGAGNTSYPRRASHIRRQSMVKVENFDITFENPDGVYYASEDVVGTISLVLREEKKVNEILLELKGKAKTYWTKHSGKSRQHYTDSEPYFCEQFNTEYTHAYGKHSERLLPAGRHEIPFSYRLPANIPSSFEGDFGHVRYTCTATLERPWDFDVICVRPFTVVGVEDLNEDRNAREPVSIKDDEFDVTLCWRKRGTISVDLSLSKAGYVPGETIHINATVHNNSNRTIKYSQARLMMHMQYRAKSFLGAQETKQVDVDIAKKEQGAILPHSTHRWDKEPLVVPSVPPKLVKCKVIDIYYSLEFEVEPGLKVITPLYIGNVPLVTVDSHHGNSQIENKATTQISPASSSPPVQQQKKKSNRSHSISSPNPVALKYPSLPLPVFEESIFGKYNIREGKHDETTHGEYMFAPRYPCYKL